MIQKLKIDFHILNNWFSYCVDISNLTGIEFFCYMFHFTYEICNFTVLSTLFGVCTIYKYPPTIYDLNDV